jgi:transposase InsO family protein
VQHVREELGAQRVSERRACKVLSQARSTQRREPYVADDEPLLTKRIIALAAHYGRYGYRRITALLRREGWLVNHKRVERIWRQEGEIMFSNKIYAAVHMCSVSFHALIGGLIVYGITMYII